MISSLLSTAVVSALWVSRFDLIIAKDKSFEGYSISICQTKPINRVDCVQRDRAGEASPMLLEKNSDTVKRALQISGFVGTASVVVRSLKDDKLKSVKTITVEPNL